MPSQVKEAVEKALAFLGNAQMNKRLAELKANLQDSNFKKMVCQMQMVLSL